MSSVGTCAACRHLRRRCMPDCNLARYFPADQPQNFLNVHRLFGIGRVLKTLETLDPESHSDAMNAMIYEANVRMRDPVRGCLGTLVGLNSQIEDLRGRIEFVRQQIEDAKMILTMDQEQQEQPQEQQQEQPQEQQQEQPQEQQQEQPQEQQQEHKDEEVPEIDRKDD